MADDGDADGEDVTVDDLRERLAAIEERLDAAETEADLDEVEAAVEDLEDDVEAAELPAPDDEDEEAPAEALQADADDLHERIADERGPYAADVVDELEDAAATVQDGEWTGAGESELLTAADAFVDGVEDVLDASIRQGFDDVGEVVGAIEAVIDAVEEADLDPDTDAETVAELLEGARTLAEAVDDAEEWDDLTVREKLAHHGFYDVLDHRKDFPPEWHALKVFEKRGDAEKVLIALDLLDSDFMERHCLEALKRMGPEEALDEMSQRAERRDNDAIEILGKIGSDEPVDTLLEYVDADSDPQLQKATFKALGEIGTEAAVQPLANQLAAESETIRSHAARALGLIGDTRAVDPLADVLAEDDSDTVRSSAAWALNAIGTERAHEVLRGYADDRAYVVQAEAEKAL